MEDSGQPVELYLSGLCLTPDAPTYEVRSRLVGTALPQDRFTPEAYCD